VGPDYLDGCQGFSCNQGDILMAISPDKTQKALRGHTEFRLAKQRLGIGTAKSYPNIACPFGLTSIKTNKLRGYAAGQRFDRPKRQMLLKGGRLSEVRTEYNTTLECG